MIWTLWKLCFIQSYVNFYSLVLITFSRLFTHQFCDLSIVLLFSRVKKQAQILSFRICSKIFEYNSFVVFIVKDRKHMISS